MPPLAGIISYLLPFVATAGAYSARVQGGVGTHAAKAGDTPFHHALSDADLTIQSFLEVALLARFPEVSFFSEEQDQSLNVKYFPVGSPLEVLLDPVDGTRSYIDKQEHYQIIVTFHDEREIVGSICFMPRRNRCYVAMKGAGAFLLTESEMRAASPGKRFTITDATGPLMVFNSPELHSLLSPHFETKDLLQCYLERPGQYNSTDLIEGRAIANVLTPVQAIDGGSLAFIASEAGAVVTDFDGNQAGTYRTNEKRVTPNLVVAATPDIHRAIISVLAKRKG